MLKVYVALSNETPGVIIVHIIISNAFSSNKRNFHDNEYTISDVIERAKTILILI